MKLKKLILFLFLISLSSYSLSAPRFQTAENTNCQVHINKSHAVRWFGSCSNGKAHGNGTVQYLKNNKVFLTYKGVMHQGLKHGQGTQTWADGDKFVGQYRNGEKNGQGTITWADGSKFVGQYRNGKKTQGTYTYSNGLKYVGQYHKGKWHGQGTMIWAGGRKFVGKFNNGDYHGQGTITWADGRKFVGQFRNDKKNGQGTMIFPPNKGYKKKQYSGMWKNDDYNGKGTALYFDGSKYSGMWVNGYPANQQPKKQVASKKQAAPSPPKVVKSGVAWIDYSDGDYECDNGFKANSKSCNSNHYDFNQYICKDTSKYVCN